MSRKRLTSARRRKRSSLPKIDKVEDEEVTATTSQIRKLTPNLKLYYTKLVLGATSGLTAGILEFTELRGLFFAFIVLLMSYWLIRYVIGITEEEMETGKIFLKGTISFFIIFTVVWTLVLQLIYNTPFDSSHNWYVKELMGL